MKISNGTKPPENLKNAVVAALENKSADDIIVIDLAGKSDMADYMIIASGTSSTHIRTLADYAERAFNEQNEKILSVEGLEDATWVIVDDPYVIVHIFHPETRDEYKLEKMWEPDFSELDKVLEPAL